MTDWRLVAALLFIVALILFASRLDSLRGVFHWLPVPLWCYALPMVAVAIGWLPSGDPVYRSLTNQLLPLALALLLLGVDLPSVLRTGGAALIAFAGGALGVVIGAPLAVWLLRAHLPPEAWTGAGSLAGTWTGGTMNLLALRVLLQTPEHIFAPLVVVDALLAYSWMALLVAGSGLQTPINRWLRAPSHAGAGDSTSTSTAQARASRPSHWLAVTASAALALALAASARSLAPHLPAFQLVSSSSGWAVLLVTTAALGLSLHPAIRHAGVHGSELGYGSLYIVLAATGAQGNLGVLWSAPVWIVVGVIVIALHAGVLVLVGRLCRIPLGILSTASQANIGGVVSGPLVGAVYHQSLAPVGLLLAMAGNALGTYLGLLAASIARALRG